MNGPNQFTPFYQSLANNGMQNTNQNINTMNMPSNQIDFPKNPNPSEIPMQPGFEEVGNFFNKPMPKGPSEIPMQQDFMDMGGPKPTDKFQKPITQAVNPNINRPMYSDDNFLDYGQIGPGHQPPSGDMGGGYIPSFDQNNDGMVDVFDIMMASQMDTSSMTPQQYEQFMASLIEWVYQEQGIGTPDINSQFPTISPSEFTGGGGIAGSLAKQLYYPSTSGGFSSVGSGISGSTLEELLNRTR